MARPKETIVPVPEGFSDEIRSGDRLRGLRAIRDLLAHGIKTSGSARDIGAMTLRAQQVLADIDELEADKRAKRRLRVVEDD